MMFNTDILKQCYYGIIYSGPVGHPIRATITKGGEMLFNLAFYKTSCPAHSRKEVVLV